MSLRKKLAGEREAMLEEDAESVAVRYRNKELDIYDLVRQYGVIVDWGSGELLEKTTAEFRKMLKTRTSPYWKEGTASPSLQVA